VPLTTALDPEVALSDVALVCMPFGPAFSPSLGLSLLKAGLASRGVDASVDYFSVGFAERIGQHFYCGISTYSRPTHRHLVGEWIFAKALFGRRAKGERAYLNQILLRRNRQSSERPVSASLLRRILAARGSVEDFLDECLRRLLERKPRVVGFTSIFHQHVPSLALAQRLKRAWPECVVVMGGANCEGPMGAETARQFPFVDAVVSGEGDVVFPELVRRALAGKPLDGLPGVFTPANAGRALATGARVTAPMVQDMDALPVPDFSDYFEQFGRSRYARDWQPGLFFESSRGCWWGERMHCTFCGLNGGTMSYRSKSAKRAVAELTQLIERHPGCDVQVTDNILDLEYFKDFVPLLAEKKLGADLFYETKANLRKDQIRLLKRAGITRLQPGVESLIDPVLKLMRKGVGALHNIQLLKWCKELGVEPHWNVLWGFPGEPPEEYERLATIVPLLRHLPPPGGFGPIRLDRFSPNFFDAERLGFSEVRPLAPYGHVYPFCEDVLRNLAYYFSYGYQEPRDVAAYVRALARQLRAWKKDRRSELLSVVAGDALVILDSRPAAREPFTQLRGVERALYEACDAVTNPSSLAASAERAGFGRLSEAEVADRLGPLLERGLILRDGARLLALAVRLGEYAPSAAAARALLERALAFGRRDGTSIVVPLAANRPAAARRPSRRRLPRSARLEPRMFRIEGRELRIELLTHRHESSRLRA
jgi:ribosomal peptide maturation radical SAM protein 1